MSPLPFLPATAADHARLGRWYGEQRRLVEAQAQYRTALALGLDDPAAMLELAAAYLGLGRLELAATWCERLRREAPDHRPVQREALAQQAAAGTAAPLAALDHNRHFRLRTLAAAIDALADGESQQVSVLDIGGGDGALAFFLPRAAYVLAEPGTNGLAGEDLPFADGSFDVVLACHVLEHVPAEARPAFLAGLCRVARRRVLLLNPFRSPAGGTGDPWLELVLAVTGAPWAREHLACGFPDLAEVQRFAAERGLPCRAEPSGARPVSTLHVLASHYAALAGRGADLPRLNALLNGIAPEALRSDELPTAWLVSLDCETPAPR